MADAYGLSPSKTSTYLDDLRDRCDKAWQVADIAHVGLREAYRWLLPQQYHRMVAGEATASATTRPIQDHIFDPTGQQALADGANQIGEAIHPWDTPWSRWSARDDTKEEMQGQVDEVCDDLTKTCNSLLSRSNFHTTAISSHQDFLISTGFLTGDIDPMDKSRTRWSASPAYRWAIEADTSGRVVALFQKLHPRARDCDRLFSGKAQFSDEVRKLQKDSPDTRVDIRWCVWWEKENEYGHWRACAYEQETKHECWKDDYRFCPVVCYRSNIIAGEPWGYGPGLASLADVKVTNKLVELVLRNAAIATAGIWQAEDDGVLNPRTVRLVPGAIIPIGMNSKGLMPLTPPGKFDVSTMVLSELRQNIRRAFYVTRVNEQQQRMTAAEYQGRKDQMIREMRGMYGQLRSEFAEPVMLRTLELAERMGRVAEPSADRLAEILLVGPLAQDVAGMEVDRIKQAVFDVESIAGPAVGMAAVNLAKLIPFIAQKRHANAEMFMNEQQLTALAQNVMQQASKMMAAQQAQAQPPQPQEPGLSAPEGAQRKLLGLAA